MATSTQTRNMPGNPTLLPTIAGGTEFLAASHFTIAQDPHATKPSLKSVFKRDYPPWEILSKPDGAVPPRPASVLQKDDRYFNEKASETRIQYEYRYAPKPEIGADPDKLRATNFKMDRDMRFNSFQTTHNKDFTPKSAGAYARAKPNQDTTKSYIPQGDRDKADEPVSDYKARYQGVDVSKYRTEKAKNMHQAGAPTILGDARQHHFNTTHNELYRGAVLPKINALPAPTGTNIPQGDVDKERTLLTVQQQSYPAHQIHGRAYDREAMNKLRETTFKQQENRLNSYVSTFADSYTPKSGLVEKPPTRTKHRNHSDFPPGDEDIYRNASQSNMTTNRFYHGNAPPTTKPDIVQGSQKRTHSNVWFGEPTHGENYYETTTASTFKPAEVPYTYKKNNESNKSNIPVDYYSDNWDNNTQYRDDFNDPLQDKLHVNQNALDSLKESHIQPPQGGVRFFSTEHTDQYTPKQSNLVCVDPGRLQRSSVPIGTLNG